MKLHNQAFSMKIISYVHIGRANTQCFQIFLVAGIHTLITDRCVKINKHGANKHN